MSEARNVVYYSSNRVYLEEVVHALHYAGHALEAHAGVDVRMLKVSVVARAVGIELGEHQVPEFNETVAVAARLAVGLAAAVLLAAVEIYLGAGSAGAHAYLPEVVLLAEAHDSLFGDAYLLVPEFIGLVVVLVYGNVKLLHRQLHNVRAELPRPRDYLVFEIIAEGEVAQHLKEGAVARRFAHALDVGRADALLTGGNALRGRRLFTREVGL